MKITFTIDSEKTADIEELEAYLTLLKKRHGGDVQTATDKPDPSQEAVQPFYDIPNNIDDVADTPFPTRPVQQPVRRAPQAQQAPQAWHQQQAQQPTRQYQGEPMERHQQSKEVPHSVYNVVLNDIFPDESKSGKQMMIFDFKITYGEYAGRHIFMRQVYSGTKNDSYCIKGIEKIINQICKASGAAEYNFRSHSAQELEAVADSVRSEIQQFEAHDMKIKFAEGYTPITIIQ